MSVEERTFFVVVDVLFENHILLHSIQIVDLGFFEKVGSKIYLCTNLML